MKLSIVAAVGALVATVNAAAIPSITPVDYSLVKRQTPALVTLTTDLMFSTPLSTFISRRNARNPSTLDWNSDGCSASPDKPLGFDFLPRCHRHDFGYRNFKIQNRFTEANRLLIDNQFKRDLYAYCETRNVIEEAACKGVANIYYEAVRTFGNGVWNVNLKKREISGVEVA